MILKYSYCLQLPCWGPGQCDLLQPRLLAPRPAQLDRQRGEGELGRGTEDSSLLHPFFCFYLFIVSMFQIYDEPPSQPHYTYTDPWAQETGRSQGHGQVVSDLHPGADTEVRVDDVWKVYFLHNCTLYSKHPNIVKHRLHVCFLG